MIFVYLINAVSVRTTGGYMVEQPDEEKKRLLTEIAVLKQKVDELTKKLHYLEAVQEHYARELEHYSILKAKIHDLFILANDRQSAMSSLEYALLLYNRESGEEQHN